MGQRYDTISFLSDLGVADEMVGVVKAVVRDMAPHVTVVDITHGIEPFDVRAGSLALARAISYVPAGIVFATVDPGAGPDRRLVAIEVAGGSGVVIGPDNGLLAPAIALAGGAGRCVVLDRPEYHLDAPGITLAARDVLAPVAAHLCNGTDLTDLGSPIDAALLLPGIVPLPRDEGDALHGEVTWVDRFGNCQLNIGPDDVAAWGPRLRVTIGAAETATVRSLAIVAGFDAIDPGAPGLVVDANGMLTIALARASAALELRIDVGTSVIVGPPGDAPTGMTTPVQIRPA